MSLNSVESVRLMNMSRDLHTMVKIMETMNQNMLALHEQLLKIVGELKPIRKELTRDVDLDRLVEDSKKIAEAGKNFEKVVDANQLEIPTFTPHQVDKNGCLFPWQWRHNLGWDKLPEEIRQQHQAHENHPMTEEAFRIYNAGLVSEFVVKTKQEEQQ